MISEKAKILLIDDKPKNLLALEALLCGNDIEIFKALRGNDALSLCVEHDFALVLTDVQMPEMDGFETADLMRGMKKTETTPIIFVTASQKDMEYIFRGYNLGCVDFLLKPLDNHIVQSKVKVFLELDRQKKAYQLQVKELQRLNKGLELEIAERKRAQEKTRLLAELGKLLTQLDQPSEFFRTSLEICLPVAADICLMEFQHDGAKKILTIAHHPEEEASLAPFAEAARNLLLYEAQTKLDSSSGSNTMVVWNHKELEDFYSRLPNPSPEADCFRKLNPTGVLTLKMFARSRPHGTLTFVMTKSRRDFTHEDMNFINDIASRCALALENLHLLARSQSDLEALLEERNLREHFISSLTHDLRNPLAAISMAAHLSSRNSAKPEAVQSNSKKITASVSRADKMIKDMLDANRIKAGQKLSLEVEDVDLHSFLHEIVGELGSVHGERFNVQCPSEIKGYWSPVELRRILENLITNAVKYGNAETPITTFVRVCEDNHVVLAVHNFGSPLTPTEQSEIFKPFYRAENAQKSGKKGWGLGLTLVQGVVEAHGGSVCVKSSEFEGTVFEVTLPVDARPFQSE